MEQKKINEIIQRYLPAEDGNFSALAQAMNYSVFAGGKRVRPILLLETCRLFCDDISGAEPFAAAIEMIHTYSLVHDDLPAMDNDELRRGKPTTWKQYGQAMGILAGDALLTLAFETASKAGENLPANLVLKAISILSSCAGIDGMCGGQALDVTLTGKNLAKEELDLIYENKTGALIRASMLIGAVIGGANADEQKTVTEIAEKIGLAFQIKDDILDVTADETTLGKPKGSDDRNHKTTFVSLCGIAQSKSTVQRLTFEAIELLETLPGDHRFFQSFIKKLRDRNC